MVAPSFKNGVSRTSHLAADDLTDETVTADSDSRNNTVPSSASDPTANADLLV